MPLLIGEKAASLSLGGALKTGKEYEPKKSIRAICEHYGSYEYDKIRPKILAIAKDPYALDIPVDIVDFQLGVLDERQVLEWNDKGVWKILRFETLRDYLLKMKREKNNPT